MESSFNRNSSKSGETNLQYTQVVILTVISTTAARGRDTTTLGLFKEQSPSVPITPHFTFHISSRLSGLKRQEPIHLPLCFALRTHSLSHTFMLYLDIYVPPFHFNHFFFSQSLSYLSFSVFSLPVCSSLHIPPWFEPSRGCIFFFFFLPFQQYLTTRCGSGRIKVANPRDVP